MPLPSSVRRSCVSRTPFLFRYAVLARARFASTSSSLPRLPILDAISRHDPTSIVVTHSLSGRTFRYGELLGDVRRARDSFLQATGKTDLNGQRIAFLVENSYDYVGRLTTRPPRPLTVYYMHILT